MLNLSVFSHNHHPSGVNLLAKYIRRGIQVINYDLMYNAFIPIRGSLSKCSTRNNMAYKLHKSATWTA